MPRLLIILHLTKIATLSFDLTLHMCCEVALSWEAVARENYPFDVEVRNADLVMTSV